MALNSYADLVASVGSWLYRDDLSNQIPDFIRLCEVQYNRDLDIRAMETVQTGTLTDAALTVPDGLNSVQNFMLAAYSQWNELNYVRPGMIEQYSARTGTPRMYTELNGTLVVIPSPDTSYDYQLFYRGQIPALSAANTTNWMLANAPDVYLWGSLLMAAPFLGDDHRIDTWRGLYDNAIRTLQQNNDQGRYSTQSPLVMMTDSQPLTMVTA